MRAGRAEPAAAARCIEPPVGHTRVRIGDEGNVLDQRGQTRFADQTVGDGAGDKRTIRCPSKLVTDERGDPGPISGCDHRGRFGGVESERLFADDVAAGVARLDREPAMCERWSGDRHRIDAGQRERVAE